MATPAFFDDLAFCDRLASQMFGETVRHFPLKKGAADPSRPGRELVALVGSEGASTLNLGGGFNMSVTAEPLTVWIDTTAQPDLNIMAGDRMRMLERPGQPFAEVNTVTRRHPTLLVLTLGAL